jgi:AcrR family transcriptional regulator
VTAPATTKRRARGTEREETVVLAAADLIAERGLANLRVSDVAERAGMSVGHVTYYFPSKTELLMKAIRRSEELFQTEVQAQLVRYDSAWERLRALVESGAAAGHGDPGWLLWFEVWASAGTDVDVAALQRDLDGLWRAMLAEVVDYGVTRGEFASPDPARAVDLLSALTDGLSVQLALGGTDLTRARLLELVLGLAAELLGAGADP